jgi:hypothetical protein
MISQEVLPRHGCLFASRVNHSEAHDPRATDLAPSCGNSSVCFAFFVSPVRELRSACGYVGGVGLVAGADGCGCGWEGCGEGEEGGGEELHFGWLMLGCLVGGRESGMREERI